MTTANAPTREELQSEIDRLKACSTCAHCERRTRDKGYCQVAQM